MEYKMWEKVVITNYWYTRYWIIEWFEISTRREEVSDRYFILWDFYSEVHLRKPTKEELEIYFKK